MGRRLDHGGLVAWVALLVGMGVGGAAAWGGEPDGVCAAYASVPLPAEAQVATPARYPGCASYKWYRGISRPVNFTKARACAWQERAAQQGKLPQNQKEGASWVVGGSLILADLYYNGDGVAKDVPLAMRLACEFEESTVELALEALHGENGFTVSPGKFEFCDYAATTFTMNFCGWYQQDVADDRRARLFRRMETPMTAEQKEAFDALLKAQKEYVSEHALEVDQEGTIRGIRTMGSQEIVADQFRVDMVHFERGQWPGLNEAEVRGAEGRVRSSYAAAEARVRKTPPADLQEGAVSAEDLAKAQVAWVRYRAAWVTFAQVRYGAEAGRVVAQVERERVRLLRTID